MWKFVSIGLVLAPMLVHAAGDPSEVRRPAVCTEQYVPVCAEKDGVRKVYSNTCFAAAEGAHVVNDGQCPATRLPKPNAR